MVPALDFTAPVLTVVTGRGAAIDLVRAADWLVATRALVGSRSLADRGPNSIALNAEDAARLSTRCASILAGVGVIGARNTLVSMRREREDVRAAGDVVFPASTAVVISASVRVFCASPPGGAQSAISHYCAISVHRSASLAGPRVTWRRDAVVHARRLGPPGDRAATWSRAAAIVLELVVEHASGLRALPILCVVAEETPVMPCADCIVSVGRSQPADCRASSWA